MTTKRLVPLITVTCCVCCTAALASDWFGYHNARFQYQVDIPASFLTIKESTNGDGGVAKSVDGGSELRVWGNALVLGDFAEETKSRIDSDRQDGWTVTYEKRQPAWAAWSGKRGGRIFYARSISACEGAVASFRIEYPAESKEAFDPIITRLQKSLKAGKCQSSR